MKRLAAALLLASMVILALGCASADSLVQPRVFKEPGWSQNAEGNWIYKEQFPFTEYEQPLYGYCTRQKVNVRCVPDNPYRKLGQLIIGAPYTILGDCADTYLCDTLVGQGWIPKAYVELLGSREEYETLRRNRPGKYHPGEKDSGGKKKTRPTPDKPAPEPAEEYPT